MKTDLETRIASNGFKSPHAEWREAMIEQALTGQPRRKVSLNHVGIPFVWSAALCFMVATPDSSRATPEVTSRINSAWEKTALMSTDNSVVLVLKCAPSLTMREAIAKARFF
jgi:hypothetical protein